MGRSTLNTEEIPRRLASSNQARDVRHVAHQVGAVNVGNLGKPFRDGTKPRESSAEARKGGGYAAHLLVVVVARVGRVASNDQARAEELHRVLEASVVNEASLLE